MSRTAICPAAFAARLRAPEVVHGYPPPEQAAGSIVISYCGTPMIVRGEFSAQPPLDTCHECVAIWETQRANAGPQSPRQRR
jgi:hypothetical protein